MNENEMNNELDNIIVLNDENGNEVQFEFLDLIEYEGGEYVVLLPLEDDEDEVVILQVEQAEDPEEESYVGVEDEEVLAAVFEIFKNNNLDNFNFT